MRRATLIVNGKAGGARRFASHFEDLRRVFLRRDVVVELLHTTAAPESARQLAQEAAKRSDLVVACGGDGTVHGVLQGVVNTPACLGVLPFGTANALARNLGLPTHPVAALQTLLGFAPCEVPLGVAESEKGRRWFLVMAGAGPDGRLVHEMSTAVKARVGRAAYYAEAARLFMSRSFPAFCVDFRTVGSERWESVEAVAMMASRIPDLGGLFRGLTAESRLHHPHLVAKLLAAPASLSLPAWIASGRSGLRVLPSLQTTLEVEELRCSAVRPGDDTYAQVDGEPLGRIPLSVKIEPRGLRLLMSSRSE